MMLCFRLFYRWLLLTWSRISRRISRVRCDLLHQQHSLLCFWFIFCKRMQRDWFKVKCLQRNLKEHSQVRAAFSRLVYLHQDCIDLGTTQFYISERFPSSKNSLVALVLQANWPFGVSIVVCFFFVERQSWRQREGKLTAAQSPALNAHSSAGLDSPLSGIIYYNLMAVLTTTRKKNWKHSVIKMIPKNSKTPYEADLLKIH